MQSPKEYLQALYDNCPQGSAWLRDHVRAAMETHLPEFFKSVEVSVEETPEYTRHKYSLSPLNAMDALLDVQFTRRPFVNARGQQDCETAPAPALKLPCVSEHTPAVSTYLILYLCIHHDVPFNEMGLWVYKDDANVRHRRFDFDIIKPAGLAKRKSTLEQALTLAKGDDVLGFFKTL